MLHLPLGLSWRVPSPWSFDSRSHFSMHVFQPKGSRPAKQVLCPPPPTQAEVSPVKSHLAESSSPEKRCFAQPRGGYSTQAASEDRALHPTPLEARLPGDPRSHVTWCLTRRHIRGHSALCGLKLFKGPDTGRASCRQFSPSLKLRPGSHPLISQHDCYTSRRQLSGWKAGHREQIPEVLDCQVWPLCATCKDAQWMGSTRERHTGPPSD